MVFGQPALAMAVDLRTEVQCETNPSGDTLNGEPLRADRWLYLTRAAGTSPGHHRFTIQSALPPMGGLGSSAAVTVAILAALHPRWGAGRIARESYGVELDVQGRASPIDTSTATHGHGIFVDHHRGQGFLWSIQGPSARWHIHHVDLPPLDLVVANTGIRPPTGPLVAGVRDRVEEDPRARRAIQRIGEISRSGLEALAHRDLGAFGKLMDEDHQLLNYLGVGHPTLDEFVEAARHYAYGAKLTGAGGGGNMIALARDADALMRVLADLGGQVLRMRPTPRGVEVHGRP